MKSVRIESENRERQALYRKAIGIAVVGNILLAAAKGVLAWATGSSALFADAANSLSDTLYSVMMGGGLYLAQRPPDETHPQGHSRVEPLVSLFIAGMMATAGATALIQSIRRFLAGELAIQPGWPTVVLVLGMLIKVGMYVWSNRVGSQARSPAILASARDNLADILTSFAALLGVWGSNFIHPFLDPAAGVLVALWIFRATWEIAAENLGYLTGRGADAALIEHIVQATSSIDGVEDVHRVIADYVGPMLRVDMRIRVMGTITLEHAHEISEQVNQVVEMLPDVDVAYVHVEPLPMD